MVAEGRRVSNGTGQDDCFGKPTDQTLWNGHPEELAEGSENIALPSAAGEQHEAGSRLRRRRQPADEPTVCPIRLKMGVAGVGHEPVEAVGSPQKTVDFTHQSAAFGDAGGILVACEAFWKYRPRSISRAAIAWLMLAGV